MQLFVYTIMYKYGKCAWDFLRVFSFFLYFAVVFYILKAFFYKTISCIVPSLVVGFEMIVAKSTLRALLAINARSLNNSQAT